MSWLYSPTLLAASQQSSPPPAGTPAAVLQHAARAFRALLIR